MKIEGVKCWSMEKAKRKKLRLLKTEDVKKLQRKPGIVKENDDSDLIIMAAGA